MGLARALLVLHDDKPRPENVEVVHLYGLEVKMDVLLEHMLQHMTKKILTDGPVVLFRASWRRFAHERATRATSPSATRERSSGT